MTNTMHTLTHLKSLRKSFCLNVRLEAIPWRIQFGAAPDATDGKMIGRGKTVVKRIKRFDERKACHMLFVSSSEVERWQEILRVLKGNPILTISDFENFVQLEG
ncbi:MAG: YfiR family protein [Syntrophobacteraceae bacterium]|nr:YfiR family protein [Syntrophobacteraceae bacterium]